MVLSSGVVGVGSDVSKTAIPVQKVLDHPGQVVVKQPFFCNFL